MIEFGYILIIIFELIITGALIAALIYLNKKVENCIEDVSKKGEDALNTIKKVREELHKFNEGVKNFKKLNIWQVKNVVLLVLDIINFIALIHSVDFKKGEKLTLKNFKKLIPFSLAKKVVDMVRNFV